MDFSFDEELELVRGMARDFADNELIPRATKHDRQESLDPEVFEKLASWGSGA